MSRAAAWPDLIREVNEDEMIQRNEVPGALFQDTQLANLISIRRTSAENILGEMTPIRATLDEILQGLPESPSR